MKRSEKQLLSNSNFSMFSPLDCFSFKLKLPEPSGHQTSFRRLMDVYMMSVRPSKIWYVQRTSKQCPLWTSIEYPYWTSNWRPFATNSRKTCLQVHILDDIFIHLLRSFMYKNVFYTTITKNFKYFSLSLKMQLLERYQGCREKCGKRPIKSSAAF